MDESGLACDKSGNLSKPTQLPSTASSTSASKRANKAQPQLPDKDKHSTQLLLEAEAAKRSKLITLNENVDQVKADREAALRAQLEDEDRAFTLPRVRGALPSESIAFLKWRGGREGQPMWQAWMAGLGELSECRRRYRVVKRRMAQQREQLLQLRVAEEERKAVRRANDEGVEVMDEDEYERYVQLVQSQKAYMADDAERVAAKQQLSSWLARLSELQVDMYESFIAWYEEKYAQGKPRKTTTDAVDRKVRWWEASAATEEDKTGKVIVEEQKVAEEAIGGEAKVVLDMTNEEKSGGVVTDVQLNLSEVSGSKPGSSASAQKKETVTGRSKASRNTTSRA